MVVATASAVVGGALIGLAPTLLSRLWVEQILKLTLRAPTYLEQCHNRELSARAFSLITVCALSVVLGVRGITLLVGIAIETWLHMAQMKVQMKSMIDRLSRGSDPGVKYRNVSKIIPFLPEAGALYYAPFVLISEDERNGNPLIAQRSIGVSVKMPGLLNQPDVVMPIYVADRTKEPAGHIVDVFFISWGGNDGEGPYCCVKASPACGGEVLTLHDVRDDLELNKQVEAYVNTNQWRVDHAAYRIITEAQNRGQQDDTRYLICNNQVYDLADSARPSGRRLVFSEEQSAPPATNHLTPYDLGLLRGESGEMFLRHQNELFCISYIILCGDIYMRDVYGIWRHFGRHDAGIPYTWDRLAEKLKLAMPSALENRDCVPQQPEDANKMEDKRIYWSREAGVYICTLKNTRGRSIQIHLMPAHPNTPLLFRARVEPHGMQVSGVLGAYVKTDSAGSSRFTLLEDDAHYVCYQFKKLFA